MHVPRVADVLARRQSVTFLIELIGETSTGVDPTHMIVDSKGNPIPKNATPPPAPSFVP